jgi:hypothetical protein
MPGLVPGIYVFAQGRTSSFIIFVDGIFTTFIEWPFTNVFDAVR